MAREIVFSENYSFDVRVHHAELGDIGDATLRFGTDHWPSLKFTDWRVSLKISEGVKYDRLFATTKINNVFTLFDCETSGHRIFADYVVAGEIRGGISEIGIRFNEINEWFMPFREVEEKLNPESVAPEKYQNVYVSIDSHGQQFDFSTDSIVSVEKSGEDHIVHEHVIFTFEKKSGEFLIENVKEKAHELSTLISILIARPLYINSIYIRNSESSGSYVFFPHFKQKQNAPGNRYWAEYFIRRPRLNGRWKDIFENYYKSEYRSISWVRLAGMQHYEGFWEYKALGYVSLLDKYVSQRMNAERLSRSEARAIKDPQFKSELAKITPNLTDEQESKVLDIIEKYFPSNRKLSFKQKFDRVFDLMDEKTKSVINFSEGDFDNIKKIRDAIAHGDAPDLAEINHDRIGIIVNKIALFLTYWAFLDFGLNVEDFMDGLNTHNKIRMGADIDRIELARINGSAGFFSVSADDFDKISKIKGVKLQPCFLKYPDGRIEYAEHHANAFKAWMKSGEHGVIPVAKIFGTSEDKIKCFGEAYIESGLDRLELTHAYFIDAAQSEPSRA